MSPTNTVRSADGTAIAYSRSGEGPPLILVDGGFGHREFGPNVKLAPLFAEEFSVFTYDRRGRGASDDTPPYAVEREVQDLEALVREAGGSAYVYGISSGGVLARGCESPSGRREARALRAPLRRRPTAGLRSRRTSPRD